MSGIKKLTRSEIKLILLLYENGQTNIRLLTAEINTRRMKNNKAQIKSINTVKNYLVEKGIYIKKIYVPVSLNKILVEHNEKTQLMKLLDTTMPTIRKALNGKCGSDISIRIRKIAIERGGIEYIPLNNNTQ